MREFWYMLISKCLLIDRIRNFDTVMKFMVFERMLLKCNDTWKNLHVWIWIIRHIINDICNGRLELSRRIMYWGVLFGGLRFQFNKKFSKLFKDFSSKCWTTFHNNFTKVRKKIFRKVWQAYCQCHHRN